MIEFKNICKFYHHKCVIEDFSLTVQKGEFIVLIGPSGCGKTTLLKMLNRLTEPTDGEILVNGVNILEENPIELRRNMGYVIQQTGLFPHMTVRENIELIPLLKKEHPDEVLQKTKRLLEVVGLDPMMYMDHYPHELSGGQQQRVGVARALATDSDIILMDEPFSALDPVTRGILQDEVVQLQKEFRKTVVFVTHDMDEAIRLADKICILQDGKIVQFDNPDEILRNPKNEFVENFIGKKRIWSNPEILKASDIMIENPVCSNKKRTVLQAMEIMKSNRVDSLLVVDKEHVLLGLVTLKDTKLKPHDAEIGTIMDRNVHFVYGDDGLLTVLSRMNERNAGYVPVVNRKKRLMGLVTRSSVFSVLSSQLLETEVKV